MRYFFLLALFPLWYGASFAVYNWKRKNRLGAVGTAILLLAAFALPFYIFFIRHL